MTASTIVSDDLSKKAKLRGRLIFWLLVFAVEVAVSLCILGFIASVWFAWFYTRLP